MKINHIKIFDLLWTSNGHSNKLWHIFPSGFTNKNTSYICFLVKYCQFDGYFYTVTRSSRVMRKLRKFRIVRILQVLMRYHFPGAKNPKLFDAVFETVLVIGEH